MAIHNVVTIPQINTELNCTQEEKEKLNEGLTPMTEVNAKKENISIFR